MEPSSSRRRRSSQKAPIQQVYFQGNMDQYLMANPHIQLVNNDHRRSDHRHSRRSHGLPPPMMTFPPPGPPRHLHQRYPDGFVQQYPQPMYPGGMPQPYGFPQMQQLPPYAGQHHGYGPGGFPGMMPQPMMPHGMQPMPGAYPPHNGYPQMGHHRRGESGLPGPAQMVPQVFNEDRESRHHRRHKHSSKRHKDITNVLDQPVPNFKYSRCTGKKKALCVGINYFGDAQELGGCVNDARAFRDFIVDQWGYNIEDTIILTDDAFDAQYHPTRENIFNAIRWLVSDAQEDDSLIFHYSGHGGQTADLDGDEVDGMDEVIYPSDYKTAGHILDDDLNTYMVQPLPLGCRLTALFDSCHSGTVLDLPYAYHSNGRIKGKHVTDRAFKLKGTNADVVSFAGCRDNEKSADIKKNGVSSGAMSHAFIQTLHTNRDQTYRELLLSLRAILKTQFDQKPQLSTSHPIDTSLKFVM